MIPRPLSPEYVALLVARSERADANNMADASAWARTGVTPAQRVAIDTEMYNDDARRSQARGRP